MSGLGFRVPCFGGVGGVGDLPILWASCGLERVRFLLGGSPPTPPPVWELLVRIHQQRNIPDSGGLRRAVGFRFRVRGSGFRVSRLALRVRV